MSFGRLGFYLGFSTRRPAASAVPAGALMDRFGNYILDRNNNYITTATAPRTS